MMGISDAKRRLEQFVQYEFAQGASEKDIETAQSNFDGSFPRDFSEFLRAFGCGYVSSEEFIGLGGSNHLNISKVANTLRQPSTHTLFPRNLVPIRSDGFGNYDCIDLLASNDEESVVVEWLHDATLDKRKLLSRGYWKWFDDILDMIEEIGG